MSENKSKSGGISFLGLLAIAFIVLKLTRFIAWSWWWVLCPLWGPVAIFLAAVPFIIIYKIRKDYYENHRQERKSKWQQRVEQMHEAQKKNNQK